MTSCSKVSLLRFWLLMAIGLTAYRRPVATTELCQDCATHRAMLSDAEITEIRIEYIKQKILKKLSLTEPPKIVSSLAPIYLPEPLIPSVEDKSKNDGSEDLNEKMDQIVLFPTEGECYINLDRDKIIFLFFN